MSPPLQYGEKDLNPNATRYGNAGAFNFEQIAFQRHAWQATSGFVTHMAYADLYPGSFPFLTEPDHPGTPS